MFDPASSTYTYLLIDSSTREAVIIDPVDDQFTRDMAVLAEHRAQLRYVVDTHVHADHITSAAALIDHTGAQAATPEGCGIKPAAIQLREGDRLHFSLQQLQALHTPGHTGGSIAKEKTSNPRITDNGHLRSVDAFVQLMGQLNLPKPRRIDEAVPANLTLGSRHDAGAPEATPHMAI